MANKGDISAFIYMVAFSYQYYITKLPNKCMVVKYLPKTYCKGSIKIQNVIFMKNGEMSLFIYK